MRSSSSRRRPLLQVTRDSIVSTVSFILQRLPFFTHFGIILLGVLGPILTPWLVTFAVLFVHLGFALCQTRSAYGVVQCWRGVVAHSKRDWLQWYRDERSKLEAEGKGDHVLELEDVEHLVLLPAYKEDVETLKEAFDVLASHHLASRCYRVCLCMEEREVGASRKAEALVREYQSRGAFLDMTYSLHPGTIVGESAGKSSNINWGARHMANRQPTSRHGRQVITVMDADTAFASDAYLSISAHFALADPSLRRRMMFVPPTLFDRNSAEVPIFTRAADIFWSCAGIGGIYPSSAVKIPTSAYFVSMELARFCDFWDAGPQAIGEDLHFYCKAVFETKGNVHAVTVYSPASQVNVVGSAGTGPVSSYVSDMKARWTQAVRHLWGSLDFGYCWTRLLTGQIGRSRPKRSGYMAIDTEEDEEPLFEALPAAALPFEDHLEMSAVPRSKPAMLLADPEATPRYPSPAGTATTDSTLVEEEDLRAAYRKSLAEVREGLKRRTSTDVTTPAFVTHSYDADLESSSRGSSGADETDDDLPLVDARGRPLRTRVFPIVVLMTRLWEAHLMIAHVFLLGLLVMTLYPAVVYRNGTISFRPPYNRSCTLDKCLTAILTTPFAASAEIPRDTAPGLQPAWIMPDVVQCAILVSRYLGAIGILATIVMCASHDFYHHAATTQRWNRSDEALRAWEKAGARGPRPATWLGERPAARFQRPWPRAILDFAAIPAGLFYGVAPLLWAQLNHLITNRLTYTVSAKSKTVVVVPIAAPVDERSVDAARRSVDIVRMSLERGRFEKLSGQA